VRRPTKLVGLAAFALVLAQAVGCGVDGVTPDCSNPAVCAPGEGDAAVAIDASGRETGSGATSDANALPDANADPKADGGADAEGGG
jgi:hypothetical protein